MGQAAEKLAQSTLEQDMAEAPPEHPFIEHERFETRMEYDPTGRLPVIVILVWAVALTGFGIYMAAYFFPDLAKW